MHHRRRLSHPIAGIALAAVVLLATAVPALAKEGIEARLDAPIARDTPGGTELLIGLTATVLDGSVTRLIEGTPFYIRLTGPGGDTTRTFTAGDPEVGHYSARVIVPASGIAEIEIGIAGSTDLAIIIVGEPIVAGGISPTTAQAAPAVAPALTPAPRLTAAPAANPAPPAADVAGASVAPAAVPAAEVVPADPAPLPGIAAIGVLAALVAALVAGGVLAARRVRDGRRPEAPGRTAGG